MIYKILAASSILTFGIGMPPPPYIKPCKWDARDFDKCALQHGKEALAVLKKGDEKYGIPNLIPFKTPDIIIDYIKNLKINITEGTAYGLETVDLKKIRIDLDAKKMNLVFTVSPLTLVGKYSLNGRLLIMPLQGNGNMNITIVGGLVTYDFDYTIKSIDGVDYLQIDDNDKLTFNMDRMIFNFDNLFDGDKLLGPQTNKFLNENWRDVVGEIGEIITRLVRNIGKDIPSEYFKKIPYKELFNIQ